MSDIPADLKAKIADKVAEGFDDRDEIIEYVAMDENAEDGGGDVTREQLAPTVDLELLRHYERQAGWERPTDCDRLDAAFADMEAHGLVARQNFS